MINIKENKSYLRKSKLKDNGLEEEKITRLDIKSDKDTLKKIADLLESKFKMYQYKENNGINFNEEEIFYYSNIGWNGKDYPDFIKLTLKWDNIKNNNIVNEILNIVKENCLNSVINIDLVYTNTLNKEKIKDYIDNFEINKNNIIENKYILSAIDQNVFSYHKLNGLKIEDKLKEIENFIVNELLDNKVIFNGMKGRIKKVGDDKYGFFKLKARVNYYCFGLENLYLLEETA